LLPPLVIKHDEAQELVKRLSAVIKVFLKQ
jgi:acetylornithine/succinyldiaminopimelate/putrescine aminotransferase